jgi:hypothetical protein
MLTWRLLQACRGDPVEPRSAGLDLKQLPSAARDRGDELPPGAAVGSGSFRESSIRLGRRLAPL